MGQVRQEKEDEHGSGDEDDEDDDIDALRQHGQKKKAGKQVFRKNR